MTFFFVWFVYGSSIVHSQNGHHEQNRRLHDAHVSGWRYRLQVEIQQAEFRLHAWYLGFRAGGVGEPGWRFYL